MAKIRLSVLLLMLFAMYGSAFAKSEVPYLLSEFRQSSQRPDKEQCGKLTDVICSSIDEGKLNALDISNVRVFATAADIIGMDKNTLRKACLPDGDRFLETRLAVECAFWYCMINGILKHAKMKDRAPTTRELVICAVFEDYLRNSLQVNCTRNSELPNTPAGEKNFEYGNNLIRELDVNSYRTKLKSSIVSMSAELGIEGETIEERLLSWASKFSEECDIIREAALMHWLFTSTSASELMQGEIPLEIERFGKDIEDLMKAYVRKDILDLKITGPARDFLQARCAALLAFPVLTKSITPRWGVIGNPIMNVMKNNRVSCFTDAVKNVIDPIIERGWQIYEHNWYRQRRTTKLVFVESGEIADCWFPTNIVAERTIGRVNTDDVFIHPLVYFETASVKGILIYLDDQKTNVVPCTLADSGWFDLDTTDMAKYKAIPSKITNLKIELEYDYTNEGMADCFSQNRDLFVKGLKFVNPEGISAKSVYKSYNPKIYLHYEKAQYKIYTIWDYRADIDTETFARSICAVVVSPFENSTPDRILAGMIHNYFDNTVLLSCIYDMAGSAWHLWRLRNSEAFKPIIARTDEITTELDDTAEERWNAAFERMEKLKIGEEPE